MKYLYLFQLIGVQIEMNSQLGVLADLTFACSKVKASVFRQVYSYLPLRICMMFSRNDQEL